MKNLSHVVAYLDPNNTKCTGVMAVIDNLVIPATLRDSSVVKCEDNSVIINVGLRVNIKDISAARKALGDTDVIE